MARRDALGAYHNQCLNEVPPFCGDGTHEAPLPTSDRVAADVGRASGVGGIVFVRREYKGEEGQARAV